MSSHLYVERSRLGKVFYEVTDHHARLAGTRVGERFELDLELRLLSGEVERRTKRYHARIIRGLGLGGLLTIATLWLWLAEPEERWMELTAKVTSTLALALLIEGFRWVPEIEIARFKGTSGRVLLDVVAEKKRLVLFEEFIEQLQQSIAASKRISYAKVSTAPLPTPSPLVLELD